MPQFTSPGAAAGNAIQQFLVQREMQQRQQMLDELMQQRQSEESDIRQRDITLRESSMAALQQQQDLDQAERMRQAARQAQRDDLDLEDRRAAKNTIGVRQMMAEGLRTGAADPRTAQLQAFGEGVDIPMDVLDPERGTRMQTARDILIHQQGLENIAAQGTQSRMTAAANRSGQAGAASGPADGPDYATQTADRTISAIDDVLPKINNWTAGAGGAFLSKFPGTDAADVSAQLSTVAGNIAFNALQQMRNASKSGGALGQVSERELDLLSSVEASIRQNQSPENLREQLGKVRESMTRFKAEMNRSSAPATGGSSFTVVASRPSPAPPAAPPTGRR